MNTLLDSPPTLATLLRRLGGVGPARVRLNPSPGTATLSDLLLPGNDGCELVDGTLVEKPVGIPESMVAGYLRERLGPIVRKGKRGILTISDGGYQLLTGLVRLPDLAFVSWDRLPGRKIPKKPYPHVIPDLAVEVLSRSNTRAEMKRKRQEYFRAGVRLVWEIDPRGRTVKIYSDATEFEALGVGDTLRGEPVIPGFEIPLAELFGDLDDQG